jgi:hypothetical protein
MCAGEPQEARQAKTAWDTTSSAVTQEGNVSPLSASSCHG